MIACDSKKDSIIRHILLGLKIVVKFFITLNRKGFKRLSANHRATHDVVDEVWYKHYVRGRFFRIRIAAVDSSIRGTGTFRRLLTPLIEGFDSGKIPIVIETHNPDSAGLYAHFGFELVRTISSPDTDVEQYCMIKRPGSSD